MTDRPQPTDIADDVLADDAPTQAFDPSESAPDWPWAQITRPAVVAANAGPVRADQLAALDWAVAATARALQRRLDRPLTITGTDDVARANQVDHAFGVALSFASAKIEALVSLDSQFVRTLVNALTGDGADLISPNSPAPIASLSSVERGLIEYLVLFAVDDVLKHAELADSGPVINAFLDAAQVEQWRSRTDARSVPLCLTMSGQQAFAQVFVAGWSEDQWSAVYADVPAAGRASAAPAKLDVRLALPAMTLQPQELEQMAPEDVLLLGASDLTSIAEPCQLVTATHWVLAEATITQDTPTYVGVRLTPCPPSIRAAALRHDAVQPMLGRARLSTQMLRNAPPSMDLQLAKDPVAPVELVRGPQTVARGELVILGAELGVRMIELVEADAGDTPRA